MMYLSCTVNLMRLGLPSHLSIGLGTQQKQLVFWPLCVTKTVSSVAPFAYLEDTTYLLYPYANFAIRIRYETSKEEQEHILRVDGCPQQEHCVEVASYWAWVRESMRYHPNPSLACTMMWQLWTILGSVHVHNMCTGTTASIWVRCKAPWRMLGKLNAVKTDDPGAVCTGCGHCDCKYRKTRHKKMGVAVRYAEDPVS